MNYVKNKKVLVPQQKLGIKGVITSFRLNGAIDGEKTQFAGQPVLKLLREYQITKNKNILQFLIDKGVVLEKRRKQNLIVTAGRTVMAQVLANESAYTGNGYINYGALGTGASPTPANGSTQLVNEVFRKIVQSSAASSNVAYVDFFYTAADTNGTYTEFGNFIDGTASANSGSLFSFIATGGWTKSAAESLFVSCQYTIT